MLDLFIAVGVVAMLSFAAYAAGLWVTLNLAPRTSGAMAVVVAIASGVFAILIRGRLFLVDLCPFSSAIILTDWLPIGVGYMTGVVAADEKMTPLRKVMVAAPITVLAWWSIVECFFTGVAIDEHPWSQFGFPVQSNNVSCSPTAAAELLRAAGIPATEREMIDVCLTQGSGTRTLGLYRALVLKTAGTNRRVQPVYGKVADFIKLPGPTLVFVYTSEARERPPQILPWPHPPGDHSIIIYGLKPNGDVDVGDPAVGRVDWPRYRLEEFYSEEGIRLVPRED